MQKCLLCIVLRSFASAGRPKFTPFGGTAAAGSLRTPAAVLCPVAASRGPRETRAAWRQTLDASSPMLRRLLHR